MYINIYVRSWLLPHQCVHLCAATGRMGNKIISILNAFTALLVTVCVFMARFPPISLNVRVLCVCVCVCV